MTKRQVEIPQKIPSCRKSINFWKRDRENLAAMQKVYEDVLFLNNQEK